MRAFVVIVIALLLAVTGSPALGGGQQEKNRRTVEQFYEAAINRKDFEAASAFLGPRYIQHNQNAADGAAGLMRFIQYLRERFPQAHSEIKRSFADGDHVILHVHAKREPDSRGMAVVDIFRLEGGRIVEHWDVHEDIIERPANGNGMF